jgi:hypothetical protein
MIKNYVKKEENNKNIFLIFIILIEINILIINIIYIYNPNTYNSLREIDKFLINTILNKYNEISEYLFLKFKTNNSTSINKELYNKTSYDNNSTIKTVKIFHRNINKRWIKLIKKDLEGKINIEIDENNPDYLIYATFGCEHILYKFNNTINIAFFTENQLPDLNFADYAVGLGHINHLDRFFTFPYIVYDMNLRNITSRDIDTIRNNVLKFEKREKFCAVLITNPVGFRLYFLNELNKYKKIDMAGRFHNNVGGYVSDKVKFLKKYKFSIAMENSEADGYASEKIIDSFLAGTIPIYYGDYMVDEYINPKSYILIKNEKDLENKINYIIQIDNDDNLYRKIMKEKVFIDDFFVDNIQNDRKKFLLHIFEQKKEFAKRVDNYHFDFREN